MMLFRPGTWDEKIYHCIVQENEYGVGDFNPEDIVIDIGCHIGSFAVLAKLKGASTVYAYEALHENYALAVKKTEGLENVFVFNKAVTRSDMPIEKLCFAPCAVGENTGGGSVFALESDIAVEAVSLDALLDEIDEPVRLLKLDCEGSEFPILFTSKKLGMIQELTGEYHNFSSLEHVPAALKVKGVESYTIAALHDYLLAQGFKGGWTHVAENLGKFRYVNGSLALRLDKK